VRNFLDGNWRQYIIERRGFFERLQKQFTYYLFGIFKHEKAPFPVTKERKFNPIQQFTYVLVVYIFVPVIIITGLGLLFPQILIHEILGISGLAMTDILHLFMTFFGTLFLIIHVYFCTIGANISANFKSIINGWHEPHD
jgi:thiosulfate reductase cytochrome b subunit